MAVCQGLDRAGPQIGLPDEPGDEHRSGTFVDVGRCSDLLHPACVHHGHAIGHGEGLLLVVGDVNEADVDFALDALQLELHHLAQLQVERAKRLVQQERRWFVHQRTGQGHPLLLATGELRGLALGELAEAHHLDNGVDLLADLGGVPLF